MVQLWVNLPKKDKMSAPKYQAIEHEKMGKYDLGAENGFVEVIAGEYKGIKGPASTFSPVNLMNARLKSGATAEFEFPAAYNTALIVVEGNISVNGETKVATNRFLKFKNEGESFSIETLEDSVVLVLSGEPLHESIAAYGPFVMNTRAELVQAVEDFESGKFGHLED